jgi:Zn-dependent metalloprotease
MKAKCHHRNPIQCVIPPYITDKLLNHGDRAVREMALRAIKLASFVRNRRAAIPLPGVVAAALAAPAGPCVFQQRVYSANNQEIQPGTLRRQQGDPPSGDKAVDQAFGGGENTFKLFHDIYGRCSIDDRGMPLIHTVHYGQKFNNAFWDGQQMVYGDGDGLLFGSFTSDIDIIGHELTHGVTQYEAGLAYQGQSGALNEHFSDVFGTLVKQFAKRQKASKADWLIGRQVLLGGAYALRSMKAPGTAYVNHPLIGTDPQPAHMNNYQNLPPWDDNGGVHINSGIPNKAFYLTAKKLAGYAWEKAGWIWYDALCNVLGPNATFQKAAQATLQTARSRFGQNSLEVRAVEAGWQGVGVI